MSLGNETSLAFHKPNLNYLSKKPPNAKNGSRKSLSTDCRIHKICLYGLYQLV